MINLEDYITRIELKRLLNSHKALNLEILKLALIENKPKLFKDTKEKILVLNHYIKKIANYKKSN